VIRQSSRGETETDSDIDLAAEFEPAARMDLFRLTVLERRIAELLGSPVDPLLEFAEKRQLQDQINPNRLACLLDTIQPRLWPISSRTWSAEWQAADLVFSPMV